MPEPTWRTPETPDLGDRARGPEAVGVAVVGAHRRGQPLNPELLALGAGFVRTVHTSGAYRLLALTTTPPKPGLVRHGPGLGARVEGELWALSPAGLGRFLATLPAPMTLGPVELDDGSWVVGFGCDHEAAVGARDITAYGSWPAYLAATSGG